MESLYIVNDQSSIVNLQSSVINHQSSLRQCLVLTRGRQQRNYPRKHKRRNKSNCLDSEKFSKKKDEKDNISHNKISISRNNNKRSSSSMDKDMKERKKEILDMKNIKKIDNFNNVNDNNVQSEKK